jgi:hypothetical protein
MIMIKTIPKRVENKGFALIITVSILVLLALVTVGLLTLSTVTVRSSALGAAQAEARANAKLALTLALGELQKTMGPDRRISARAETLAKDPRLGASVPANTGKAWWVGVSNSDPDKGVELDAPVGTDNPSIIWLVSGLDRNATPGSQISGGQRFENPVKMYGDKTIDTVLLTGGSPIEAGSVMVMDQSGRSTGGYAYFIDDNGMKAQLAATNPQLRNDNKTPLGGGVVPGSYDLSILDNMDSLAGAAMEDYNKIGSLNDLPLIGGDLVIARQKRLGYTTRSLGVLTDVRKGGLKRDLTIAFERDDIFTSVFPKSGRGGGFGERYLVLDSTKFKQSRDLQKNGYIHWEMFKDYYNIKKSILKKSGRGGADYLDSIMITKSGIFNGYQNTAFGRGQLGPHAIGPNSDVPGQHQQMPYGDYSTITSRGKTEDYKHSPVTPILSRMQQNAWLDLLPPAGRGKGQRLKTNVQLWKSQYNPYNVGLNIIGDAPQFGPRIIHYPQVHFSIPQARYKNSQGVEVAFDNIEGFSGKRQSSVPHEVLLGPGRSHVFAFKNYGEIGKDNDEFLYDDKVRDLTLQSIYREYELATGLSGKVNLTVDFILERPSMMHGANSNARNASHEVAQTMWSPFCFDVINRRFPGKTIKKSVSSGELNENTMASFAFNLRTTREGSGAIRPLVDANIRALMCNTKWDSPLGLPLLAAYSPENEGETDQQIFDMDTRDNPFGYTYWGGGRDPLDGFDRVILFDIPREDLVSLGQLQHAGVGRFSYEPTYIVGNSYANLRIPLEDWKASVQDTFSRDCGLPSTAIPGSFNLYDASYLVNEELWDSYIFTTIPQVADNYGRTSVDPRPTEAYFKSLLAGEALLPNPRFLPYEPPGSRFDVATTQMQSSSRGTTGAFYHNAGHLMVDGAFNVNSTSVDAWEAFLSGTHQLPYQKLSERGAVTGFSVDGEVKGVRFPRVKSILGDPMEKDRLDENYWTGFRTLEQEEVRELAEAIVKEVKERGPFLTLGEFINRKLDYGELGERGALQAALDATVNSGLDNSFEESAGHASVPKDSTQGAGFPGQLLQGDILQALSPCMTVRSDTFTIRAYGESRNPGSNEVRARAWCEATVQRYPDPVVDPDSEADPLAELVNPTSKFGRRFRMVSFRWLSPNEI